MTTGREGSKPLAIAAVLMILVALLNLMAGDWFDFFSSGSLAIACVLMTLPAYDRSLPARSLTWAMLAVSMVAIVVDLFN
jgi:hypothetical protein